MSTPFRLAAGTLGALLLLPGCAALDGLHKYRAISEAPAKGGLSEPMQPHNSTIQPALRIPIAALQPAAHTAAARVLPSNDNGRERIAQIRILDPVYHNCIFCETLDVDWHYQASLAGPVVLAGQRDRLSVTVPTQVDGRFGLDGKLARLFAIQDKRVEATAELTVSSGLKADLQYCPSLDGATLTYRWLKGPNVEVVGRHCIFGACIGPWNYNFARQIEPRIKAAIPGIVAGMQDAIPCEPVRQALIQVWRNHSLPVVLPYLGQMHLNIEPHALQFPAVGVNAQELTFGGRLDASVSLDAAAVPSGELPLPLNLPTPVSPGRFALAVPLSTQYYTFAALARQELVGKKFRTDTPLGRITVRPKRVDVYPSADRLAIGIAFVLDYQYAILSSSGTLWLSAKPSASASGKKILLSGIAVTRKFSNPIWNVASVLLQDTLANAIGKGFELDLAPPLLAAERQLSATLSQAGQKGGIVFSPSDVRLGVGRILTNDKLFQVEAIFDAQVNVELGGVKE